jgi:hypothetical protein
MPGYPGGEILERFKVRFFFALAICMLMCLYITGNVESVLSCMDTVFMKVSAMETQTLKCMVDVTTAIFDVFEKLSSMDKATLMARFFTVYNSIVMPLDVVKKMHSDMPAYVRYATGKHHVLIREDSTVCDEFGVFETQYTLVIDDICLGTKIAQIFYQDEPKDSFCRYISDNVDSWRVKVNHKCEELARKNTNSIIHVVCNTTKSIFNWLSVVDKKTDWFAAVSGVDNNKMYDSSLYDFFESNSIIGSIYMSAVVSGIF